MDMEKLRNLQNQLEDSQTEGGYLISLERLIGDLLTALLEDDDEDLSEHVFYPPKGMAILVYLKYSWRPAVSDGFGYVSYDGFQYPLNDIRWSYWPAPTNPPDHMNTWIATSDGEYRFYKDSVDVGEMVGLHGNYVIYAEDLSDTILERDGER